MVSDLVHLHVHTVYSVADGAIHLEELSKHVKSLNMTACAITDHGTMSGVPMFYEEMKKQGIKPIIGYESYTNDEKAHLILLAKTNEGYKNLLKINTLENVDGFTKAGKFAKGALDLDEVARRGLGKGVIACTACLSGTIARKLIGRNDDKKNIHYPPDYKGAVAFAEKLDSTFEDVYLELQYNTTKDQQFLNMELLRLSKDTGLPIIITKDAHYLKQEDWEAHDALLAKQVNKKLDDPDRWRFPGGPDYYICSEQEMVQYCKANNIPLEAISNTLKIANDCNVELYGDKGVYNGNLFPDYPFVPKGYTQDTYLIHLAVEGLIDFFNSRPLGTVFDPTEYIKRLKFELDIIIKTGFSGYFLILWDFLKWCRKNNIGTGAGRGSGVGSLVCRSLNITKMDPIKYNLLFERFLNPERKSPPDVDLDIASDDRPKVIEYLQNTYGADRVGQIITFGTFKLAGGTRELLRLKGLNKAEQDALVKFIPDKMPDDKEADIDLLVDLYMNPDNYRNKYGPEFDNAYNIAKSFHDATSAHPWLAKYLSRMENCVTSTGAHAGGVLIFPGPSENYVPMNSSKSSKSAIMNISQYDMGIIDKLCILKIDVLGLKTTAKISRTAARLGIDIDAINLEDDKVFELLRKGLTTEVFQFASPGMTKSLIDAKVNSLEHLIAMISLYRPGPLNAIDVNSGDTIYNTYIKCLQTGEPVKCHPRLWKILEPTMGNIIYQEQVMQVVMEMGCCTLGYADVIRRAMGKKKDSLMKKLTNEFLFGARVYDKDENGEDVYNINNELVIKPDGNPLCKGACNNGFTEEEARGIWNAIVEFAKYAFNKSHAAAYAYNSYQTAWLKCYYPADFLANCMSITDKAEDIITDIKEAKKLGVPVLPIDVNKSYSNHVVEMLPDGRKAIRLGFSLIAGISNADIVAVEREANGDYVSVVDFFNRIPGNALNRTKAPNVILSGGFDSIEPNRHKVFNYYFGTIRKETAITQKMMNKAIKDEDKKITSSCYVEKDESSFCDEVKFAYETDLLKICISGHPLDKYPYQPWEFIGFNQQCECYAIIREVRVRQDKQQRAYAFFKAECLEDTRDCVMWANDYAKYGTKIVNGKTILLRGIKRGDLKGNPQLVVNQAIGRFNTNVPLNETPKASNGQFIAPVFEDPLASAFNKPSTVNDILYNGEHEQQNDELVFDYC